MYTRYLHIVAVHCSGCQKSGAEKKVEWIVKKYWRFKCRRKLKEKFKFLKVKMSEMHNTRQ